MKKLFGLLSLAVALGFLASTAEVQAKPAKKNPEERFKALDADADGTLTEEEFVGKAEGEKADKARARFKKLDKDNDSKLTLEEFKATKKKKKKQ